MNRIEDKELVRLCVAELSERMGYANARALSQRDYEHLCGAIEEKTGILISISTIKRIFAGKFDRLPQSATLNALTLFMGYGGWQDFKTRKLQAPPRLPPPVAEPPAAPVGDPGVKRQQARTFLRATALLVLVSAGLFVVFLAVKEKEPAGEPAKAADVRFSARKAVPVGVPNSVVFSYNVDHVEADSFFIQQSWDPARRVAVGKKSYTLTDIYYEPGYHKAKLIADGKILKEIPVSIPTEGWMVYSRPLGASLPQYVKSPIIHDNRLGVTPEDLRADGIDPREDRYYLYSFFPPVLDASGDHFTLRARLRMRTVKPTRCPGMLVGVFCENDMFYFKRVIPGCISEIDVRFSDTYLSGKKHDLSAFGQDVFNWQEIEIRVAGGRVEIVTGEKPVFEAQYTKPAGLIKGFSLISTGLCEADWVELQDAAGKVVYRDDFNGL